ncbi:MAG: hypothetical protein OIF57_07940 [Marinobacterium sp.]|nr:hypothetical protein [Marinobacterium sp.]
MSFNPVFTDTGRAAAATDNGRGLHTQIAAVGLGSAQYAIRDDAGAALETAAAATALQNEMLRLPIYAGGDTVPSQIKVVAEVPPANTTDDQFFIGEIGFYDDNGVLIALWSDLNNNLGYRGDLVGWYLSLTLSWVDLPGDQFTVEVLNGPLSEQIIITSQLSEKVRIAVETAGIDYNPNDPSQLAQAIDNPSSTSQSSEASPLPLLALLTGDVKNKTRILLHESRLSQLEQQQVRNIKTTEGNNNVSNSNSNL